MSGIYPPPAAYDGLVGEGFPGSFIQVHKEGLELYWDCLETIVKPDGRSYTRFVALGDSPCPFDLRIEGHDRGVQSNLELDWIAHNWILVDQMTVPDDYENVCQRCNRLRIDCFCPDDETCPECGADLGDCDCGDIADL